LWANDLALDLSFPVLWSDVWELAAVKAGMRDVTCDHKSASKTARSRHHPAIRKIRALQFSVQILAKPSRLVVLKFSTTDIM
jgi:hypothetical protein